MQTQGDGRSEEKDLVRMGSVDPKFCQPRLTAAVAT